VGVCVDGEHEEEEGVEEEEEEEGRSVSVGDGAP
jgi:hypothetical protein